MIIDRDKVNHFKQHRLQQLIDVIRAEGQPDSNYSDCLNRYIHILCDFKEEGMQMLIFKHKEQDVQQSTLVHKSIQTYRPPSDEANSLEESKGEKPPRIPAFLIALASLFQTDDLRPFLEDDNQFGNTPLHYAIKNNFIEVARFLIHRCRVNINVSNKMGNTPLHMAVLNNRSEIVEMLVDAKIDVLQENKEGNNCLDHAEKMERASLCEYLEPVMINQQMWQQKNCLIKILLNKQRTKFNRLSIGVFREIIKYA